MALEFRWCFFGSLLVLAVTSCAFGAAAMADAAAVDELCLTGNARRNQNLPVAFDVKPLAAAALFDGSHLDKHSLRWPGGPITLDFGESVRIARVEVVVYNDGERSYNAAGRMRVRATHGGKQAEQTDWVSLDDEPSLLCGADDVLVWGAKVSMGLVAANAADALEISIEKQPQAHQCLVRELLVWGVPERLHTQTDDTGPVPGLRADENTYSSIKVMWKRLPPGADYVRVRYRSTGAEPWRSACFTSSPGLILWVKPDTEYEVVGQAVGCERSPEPAVVHTVRLPHPLQVHRMGDTFGMSFYPGGGGAHQGHDDENANTKRMIRLMRAAGVQHARWFSPSPGGAELFAEAGMSLLPFATYEDPAQYAQLTRELGVWLTATDNEPDFADTLPAWFVGKFIPRKRAAAQFDPLMALAGPAVGGEMFGPGADYLAECYHAGLKDAIHVLDLHPYGKVSTPTPPGAVIGGPEGQLASFAQCRGLMARFGDAERPIIVSETGHPNHEGFWWMPPSTRERQAQWIVRNHLLLAALGVRRVYHYAFQDEGTDRKNPEHNFGIVDWHGVPKPAYRSYSVMTRLLSKARCEGLQADLEPPAYGVCCAMPAGYITALWDSGGEGEVRLPADSEITSVTDLMGHDVPVPAPQEGLIVLPINDSVRYVYSRRPLRCVSQRRIAPPIQPRFNMTLEPSTVHVKGGQTAKWVAILSSEFDCQVTASVGCAHPWGGRPISDEVVIGPRGRAQVALAAAAPPDAKPGIISWDTRVQYQPADPKWSDGDFRRALFFVVPAE